MCVANSESLFECDVVCVSTDFEARKGIRYSLCEAESEAAGGAVEGRDSQDYCECGEREASTHDYVGVWGGIARE